MLTPTQLNALIDLAGKATPGPYEVVERGHKLLGFDVDVVGDEGDGIPSGSRGMFERQDDAAFFAALDPATVTDLARELLALREQIATFTEAARPFQEWVRDADKAKEWCKDEWHLMPDQPKSPTFRQARRLAALVQE